jgi:hypothetical protein
MTVRPGEVWLAVSCWDGSEGDMEGERVAAPDDRDVDPLARLVVLHETAELGRPGHRLAGQMGDEIVRPWPPGNRRPR